MNKSSHFIGQPAYGQLISLLDKAETLAISRSNGGERFVRYDYVPTGGDITRWGSLCSHRQAALPDASFPLAGMWHRIR